MKSKEIARLLYFTPGLSQEKMKYFKEVGILKDAIKIMSDQILNLSANELYMILMGLTGIKADKNIIAKFFKVAIEKEDIFNQYQAARLYRVWYIQKNELSSGFSDNLILKHLKIMKYADLAYLIQIGRAHV